MSIVIHSPFNQIIDLSIVGPNVGIFGGRFREHSDRQIVIAYEDAIVVWKAMDMDDQQQLSCMKFKYEVGGKYSIPSGSVQQCYNGFHGCINPNFCLDYYEYDRNTVMTQCKVWGEMDFGDGITSDKICAQHIEVIQIVPWEVVSKLINDGVDNIGHDNIGSNNKGDFNIGHDNNGSFNHGSRNIGDRNRGAHNIGSFNVGQGNIGYNNVGNFDGYQCRYNIGSANRGIANTGNYCVGYLNCCERGTYGVANKEFHPNPNPTSLDLWICDELITLDNTKQLEDLFSDVHDLIHRFSMNDHYQISLSVRTLLDHWVIRSSSNPVIDPFKQRIVQAAYDHRQLFDAYLLAEDSLDSETRKKFYA